MEQKQRINRGIIVAILALVVLLIVHFSCSVDPSIDPNADQTNRGPSSQTPGGNPPGGGTIGGPVGGNPQQGQTTPVTITVGSVNTHLLFDTVCDSGRCTWDDWERLPSQAEFDAHVNKLREDIEELDADVVVLQEVENKNALEALRAVLPAYPYGAIAESGGAASIDTAVLSKYPFAEQVQQHNITRGAAYSARDMIEAKIVRDKKTFYIYGVHLQSKVSDKTGAVRSTQAKNLVSVIRKRSQEDPFGVFVVGGDFNDTQESAPLKLVTDGGFSFVKPASDWWTYNYKGDKEAIDHILYLQKEGVKSEGLYIKHHAKGSDHAVLRAKLLAQ